MLFLLGDNNIGRRLDRSESLSVSHTSTHAHARTRGSRFWSQANCRGRPGRSPSGILRIPLRAPAIPLAADDDEISNQSSSNRIVHPPGQIFAKRLLGAHNQTNVTAPHEPSSVLLARRRAYESGVLEPLERTARPTRAQEARFESWSWGTQPHRGPGRPIQF